MKRIRLTGKTLPRVKITPSKTKRISPDVLAVALGATVVCASCTAWQHDLVKQRAANPAGYHSRPKTHPRCKTEGCGCACRDGDAPYNRFLINVGWADGNNPMFFQGRISADTGLPIPDPPPTEWEMAEVAAAAKRALLRVLRVRKRAPRDA